MADNKIYNKGIVPRREEFQSTLKLKGEVLAFIRETLEKTTEEAFSNNGFPQADKPAGFYGDGRAYGMGTATNHFNVKIGGQTQTMMEKQISFGGKRMFVEVHIAIQSITETMEMKYRTSEASAFRGYNSAVGPMMINEHLHFDLKDMKKFKTDFTAKMKEFAAKEAAYMGSTKLGTEDPIEVSTASMVESKRLSINDVFFASDEEFLKKVNEMDMSSSFPVDDTDQHPTDDLLLSDKEMAEANFASVDDREVDEKLIGQNVVITKVGDRRFGESGTVRSWHTNSNGHKFIYYTIDFHSGTPEPEGYIRSDFDSPENALNNEAFNKALEEITTAGAGAGSIGRMGYDAPLGKPAKRKFADTEYGKRERLREMKGTWAPMMTEGDDGFWTVVSQETLNRYKKDHIMGAPGADVDINSEAEEEYNSGGVNKFPQGKAFTDGDFERYNAAQSEAQEAQKASIKEYMSIDPSVRKKWSHETPITESERNARWERLSTFDPYETIRKAESVTPDKILSESVVRKTENDEVIDVRNQNIEEGDMVDGSNIIKVFKKNTLFNIEHLVKESEYLDHAKAYIHDYMTGNLVNNPNYKPI